MWQQTAGRMLFHYLAGATEDRRHERSLNRGGAAKRFHGMYGAYCLAECVDVTPGGDKDVASTPSNLFQSFLAVALASRRRRLQLWQKCTTPSGRKRASTACRHISAGGTSARRGRGGVVRSRDSPPEFYSEDLCSGFELGWMPARICNPAMCLLVAQSQSHCPELIGLCSCMHGEPLYIVIYVFQHNFVNSELSNDETAYCGPVNC